MTATRSFAANRSFIRTNPFPVILGQFHFEFIVAVMSFLNVTPFHRLKSVFLALRISRLLLGILDAIRGENHAIEVPTMRISRHQASIDIWWNAEVSIHGAIPKFDFQNLLRLAVPH